MCIRFIKAERGHGAVTRLISVFGKPKSLGSLKSLRLSPDEAQCALLDASLNENGI